MPLPSSIRLGDLKCYAAVVEARSFTAAGRQLGESTKQVSRRVSALETALGSRLLHRTTRSLRPTVEGASWYQSCREALDLLERSAEQLQPTHSARGRVRVQVPTLFLTPALDWVARQLSVKEGLEIDLLVGDSADDMVERGLDVVLTAAPPSNAGVVLRRLGLARARLMAHPSYLQRAGVPLRPKDLTQHQCLRFLSEQPQGESHWTLAHQDGRLRRIPVSSDLACNDSRTLERALHLGLGIGPQAGPSELEQVLPGWHLAGMEIFIAIAPGRRRLARVRLVVVALEQLARDMLDMLS